MSVPTRDRSGADTDEQAALRRRLARSGSAGDCRRCRDATFDRPLGMAFQPIVDPVARIVLAYEALVRGPQGEPAATVLGAIDAADIYGFDQACRVTAIETAAALGLGAMGCALTINFLPNAVYEPRACIARTLQAMARTGLPLDRLIFEINEGERLADLEHLRHIVAEYASMGFRTAIDDFGAGYSNLNLLAGFRPDLVKLDMMLINGIDADRRRQTLVRHCVRMCQDLGVEVIAEGIETAAECAALLDLGVTRMQGFLFAPPGFRCLPQPRWPA